MTLDSAIYAFVDALVDEGAPQVAQGLASR